MIHHGLSLSYLCYHLLANARGCIENNPALLLEHEQHIWTVGPKRGYFITFARGLYWLGCDDYRCDLGNHNR